MSILVPRIPMNGIMFLIHLHFFLKTITTIFLHLRNKIFENMTHQYPDVCEIFNLFALSEAW